MAKRSRKPRSPGPEPAALPDRTSGADALHAPPAQSVSGSTPRRAETATPDICSPSTAGAPSREQSGRHAEVKHHAKRQFERWALSYDRSMLNELVFYPSIRACQEEIFRWKQARGEAAYRMLDVGCGTGSLLGLMARDTHAELLVGLDYAAMMVRNAAAKFAQSPHPDKLVAMNGDSERLPLADGSIDVITCCNSFHHYPHQAEVARGFHRVLRPGGLLVLIDGFRDNVIGWVVFDLIVAGVEKHVHHASWSLVRSMLSDAGFAEVRQRKMNVLAPLLVTVARKPDSPAS